MQKDKTFRHWARAFLNHQQTLVASGTYAATTHANEVTHLFSPEQGLSKALGHRDVNTLRERDLLAFFKAKDASRETPLSASTRNKYLNVFKNVVG